MADRPRADRPTLPPELEDALRAPVALHTAERGRRVDAIMGALHAEPAPKVQTSSAPSWLDRLRVSRQHDLPPTVSRWRRRGVLGSAGALAVAAVLTLWVGVTSLTDVFSHSATVLARAEVIGDTVIPRLVPRVESALAPSRVDVSTSRVDLGATTGARSHALGDTLYQTVYDTLYDTIYDTMRIVRFALRAPSANHVALVRNLTISAIASTTSATDVNGTHAEQRFRVARDLASGLWELRTVVPRDAVAQSYAFVVNETDRVPVRATSWTTRPPAAARTSSERPLSDTSF